MTCRNISGGKEQSCLKRGVQTRSVSSNAGGHPGAHDSRFETILEYLPDGPVFMQRMCRRDEGIEPEDEMYLDEVVAFEVT